MKAVHIAVVTAAAMTVTFQDGQDKMWTCTIEYRDKKHTLTMDESKRVHELLKEREEKAGSGTTDKEESVYEPPQSVFEFAKEGAEPIRYLLFHEDSQFSIEVATGKHKTRRTFFGDETLRTKIEEIISNAFPKK